MSASPNLVLRGVNILGPTGEFDGPYDVAVVGGRVDAVAAELPAADRNVDAAGLFLMPGIFDCHVHTGVASYDTLELLETPISRRILETAHTLKRTLEAGVTFVRDAGVTDAGVRDAVAAELVPGPTMQVSVNALSPTGGHGDGFLAGPGLECSVDYMLPDYPGRPPHLVDGPDEMRKAVRLILRAGADWIKLLATRGVLAGADGDFDAELSAEEIAVAVSEAGRRHRPVMVHALGGESIQMAVDAGARSIEHGVFLTEGDAARMAERGCFLVPTLVVYDQLAAAAKNGEIQGGKAQRALAVGEVLGEAVAIAKQAGVKVALGSDFAHRRDHGHNLAELALLERAGLTRAETLLAATTVGAELCGVGERYGRIAPGYEFDALLLDEEPSDLGRLSRPGGVPGVFKSGIPVIPHPRLTAW